MMSALEKKELEVEEKYKVPQNIWIVKPGENTNRGYGINVCGSILEVKRLVDNSSNHLQNKTYIVQKYIERPLLVHKRKFDIRCYGLITSVQGNLKGYFYRDGYLRTSCKEFSLNNLHNKFVHLTNDAIQIESQDYGKYETGNKISFADFQKYLDKHLPELNVDFHRDVFSQIKRIIADTYRAVYDKIDPQRRINSYELFGYDFMIDDEFKVYLIECNTNPCLELSSPLLARIIPALLDNTFRLAVDPLFPPPDYNNTRKSSLNEILPENKFELVFDETIDGPEIEKLFKGKDKLLSKKLLVLKISFSRNRGRRSHGG